MLPTPTKAETTRKHGDRRLALFALLLILATPSLAEDPSILVGMLFESSELPSSLDALDVTFMVTNTAFIAHDRILQIYSADGGDGEAVFASTLLRTVDTHLSPHDVILAGSVWPGVPGSDEIWKTVSLTPSLAISGHNKVLISVQTTADTFACGEVRMARSAVTVSNAYISFDEGQTWTQDFPTSCAKDDPLTTVIKLRIGVPPAMPST